MKNSLNRLFAGIACTALIAGLSVPAHAAEAQPEPYAISAAQWSREDFSQDANPDVFTATYDRALYNAIRQTLVDGTSDTAPRLHDGGRQRVQRRQEPAGPNGGRSAVRASRPGELHQLL